MRRFTSIAAAMAVCAALVGTAGATAGATGAGVLDGAVEARLATLGDGEQIAVEIRLQRPHPDAGSSAEVVSRLRAAAAVSQASILGRLAALAATGRVSDVQSFWISNSVVVTADADTIVELSRRLDVVSITPAEVEIVPSYSPSEIEPNLVQVGAPTAWAAGNTGQGVVIATLDAGVDAGHPDIAGSYRGGTNSWFDGYGNSTSPYDPSGHGTAAMSVIVGRDTGGSAIGIAPDAEWISAKIFRDNGTASSKAIHSAFQWVLDPDSDPATDDTPDVVSNSWTNGSGGCDTTFQPDLEALVAAGILPIFAAGNVSGAGPGSSRSPGNLPEAFSVGAVDGSNVVWSSSSRGPSACAGDAQFPDIVAPGVSVRTAWRFNGYATPSGTSIAAPHVAGALALLLSEHPGLSVSQQIEGLTGTATDLGAAGPDDVSGFGLLDITALMSWEPPNQPPVASFSISSGKKGSSEFDARASFDPDGTIVSWDWDFGDGTTGSGETVTTTLSGSGPWTIVLTVTDDQGAVASVSEEFTGSGGGGGGGKGGGGKGKH